MNYAGISSLHIQFGARDSNRYNSVYHSNYDSIYWMKNFGDPDFVYHGLLAQLFGTVAMQFSDSVLLPFDVTHYASSLADWVQQLQNQTVGKVNFTSLVQSTVRFNQSAVTIARDGAASSLSVQQVRSINDRLMMLDRSFLGPPELSGDVFYRHILFAPTASNG
jgi:N-acetylated-alpha-linked acidic dipeptidase